MSAVAVVSPSADAARPVDEQFGKRQRVCQDQSIHLSSGKRMPSVGFGTLGGHGDALHKDSPSSMGDAVLDALAAGYRHIDCAECYKNEKEMGTALRQAFAKGLRRDEIFVTSKVWNTNHAKNQVRDACLQSLASLGLEYLDLYLVHWPVSFRYTGPALEPDVPRDGEGVVESAKVPLRETWEAMEALVDDGLVRSIGVSNYSAVELSDLLAYCRIAPSVNQVECHPYLAQRSLRRLCAAAGIAVVAFSPLGAAGRRCGESASVTPLRDPLLLSIAEARGCSVAQLILRWLLQEGLAVIPKSANPQRMRENLLVAELPALSDSELTQLRSLDRGVRYNNFDWALGGAMVFGP